MPEVGFRVLERSTTTGQAAYQLTGAPYGFQSFVAGIGDGEEVYYVAEDVDLAEGTGDWEIGIGTITAGSPAVLSRTTILANSEQGSNRIAWSAGTRNVFSAQPAARFLQSMANLSDVADVDEARANIGLGAVLTAAGHGFGDGDVGKLLRFTGTSWVFADSDGRRAAHAILSKRISASRIAVMNSGFLPLPSHGKPLGQHWLGAAGGSSTSDPTATDLDAVSQKVLVAVDSNTLLIGIESARR